MSRMGLLCCYHDGLVESGGYLLLSRGSTDNETQQSGLKWTEGEKLPLPCTGNQPKPEAAGEIQKPQNNLDVKRKFIF